MKTPLLAVSLILFSCFFSVAQDNPASFGLKAGLNLSIFSASVNSESSFKPGLHVGGYMRKPISANFFFRPEIYFSSQGQKDDYQLGNGTSIGATETTTNYINVPVLFEVGRKVSFQFGPQVGFLLSAREEGTIDNEKVDDDLKEYMKSTDFSGVLGIGVSPGEHFNFGARANIGLTNFNDTDGGIDVKHRVIHFYVAYSF